MQEYLKNTEIKILSSEDGFVFDIQIVMFGENSVSEGRIIDKYRLTLILIRECASVDIKKNIIDTNIIFINNSFSDRNKNFLLKLNNYVVKKL